MGFDVSGLRAAVAAQGRVARVVVADVKGSAPREVGAAMLVWDRGQSGTIGGGTLEFEAAAQARQMLVAGAQRRLSHHALGPDLGQCCGGRVSLLVEVYTAENISQADNAVVARSLDGSDMPLSVARLLDRARREGQSPAPQLLQNWVIEPVHTPETPLWIWGAGHVGRALVATLSPLPEFDVIWVDIAPDRFPDAIPENVTPLPAAAPEALMPRAPQNAQHLIVTFSHELDLSLCHGALQRGFAFAGLIGSATKWARFQKRLTALGHHPDQIARITCPIGDPALGKHPQAIAIGVAAQLLAPAARQNHQKRSHKA